MPRSINRRYDDPLDLIWLHAAKEIGVRVIRSRDVFAHWTGTGELHIGERDTLDPDDTLAQMILHELCHGLIEGPDCWGLADWGLENDPRRRCHEWACLRLQAALADEFGLRSFFASTTMFRPYYDRLPSDPLHPGVSLEGEQQRSVEMARVGWDRAKTGQWAQPLAEALGRTKALADIVRPIAEADSLWT